MLLPRRARGELPPREIEGDVDASQFRGRKTRRGRSKATTSFARDQLKAIIERIERLEEEKKATSDDIRDVYAEAKGNGFDVKALRTIVRLRKLDTDERREQEDDAGDLHARAGDAAVADCVADAVMPGLVPGIRVFAASLQVKRRWPGHNGVHARLRRAMPGHDADGTVAPACVWPNLRARAPSARARSRRSREFACRGRTG